MATLFLICGLPGTGKTTLARRLEEEHAALRLTPDEWMSRIVGDGYDAERRQAVHAVQWDIAERALTLGLNVILDFGFFHRRERDDYRARGAKAGADVKTVFLDVPREELSKRLAARNAALPPDTFRVEEAHLDRCEEWFERPTPEELN